MLFLGSTNIVSESLVKHIIFGHHSLPTNTGGVEISVVVQVSLNIANEMMKIVLKDLWEWFSKRALITVKATLENKYSLKKISSRSAVLERHMSEAIK